MIYFTYNLLETAPGISIGPAAFLPSDSVTGYLSASGSYYGCANIESLDVIAQFGPVEITSEEYFAVLIPPASGSF